ncbi:MAG: response regulator [Bacillota bacterium]
MLDTEGYYVKAVMGGEDVLNELNSQPGYDLVILDVMMPRVSGYEVLDKITNPLDALAEAISTSPD